MESIQCSTNLLRGFRAFARVRRPRNNHKRIGVAFLHRRGIETASTGEDFNVEDISTKRSPRLPGKRGPDGRWVRHVELSKKVSEDDSIDDENPGIIRRISRDREPRPGFKADWAG